MSNLQVLDKIFIIFCVLFGIQFNKLNNHGIHFKKIVLIFIIQLQMFYWIISAVLALVTCYMWKNSTNTIGFYVHLFQVLPPLIIMVYIVTSAFMNQDKHQEISNGLENIDKILNSVSRKTNNYPKNLIWCFIRNCNFMIILKVLRIYLLRADWYNVWFSCSIFIPELICYANDYLFIFFINLLTNKIKKLNKSLSSRTTISKSGLLKLKKTSLKIIEISQKINAFYSKSLCCTIFYNFVSLVLCLYWLFTRIVYNHLNS